MGKFNKLLNRFGYELNGTKIQALNKHGFWKGKRMVSSRFEPYEITFRGKTLYIHDASAFDLGNNELFRDHIYLFKSANPSPYIIDCGANMGMSILYFKSLFDKARIVGFEADPHIFSFLKKNVQSFGLSNTQIFNKAIWDNADETLSFMSEGGAGGRIEEVKANGNYVNVQTFRLRDLLDEKVDFLKIDIEGAEYNVIKDCADKLQNVENLFIEYHSFEGKPQVLHEILEIVADAGFRYHIKHEFTSPDPFVERIYNIGMDLQLNIFCYREK